MGLTIPGLNPTCWVWIFLSNTKMDMKRLPIYTLLLLSLVFNACNKDFLNSVPYSTTSVENFYKSANDAELALTGCYNILIQPNLESNTGGGGGLWFRHLHKVLEAGTDVALPKYNAPDPRYGSFALISFNSTTEIIGDVWLFFYAGINRCNILLDKIQEIDMDAGRKTEIIAETRFLRGLLYYYAGTMFGGIPLISQPVYATTNNSDVMKGRDELSAVFQFVIDDFQFAYENLPHRNQAIGRANRWSAAGFLARTCAYLASSKINGVGNDLGFLINSFEWVDEDAMYGKVLELTDDIIVHSGYELIPKYDYLFRESTKSTLYKECLFLVEASSDPAVGIQWFNRDGFIPSGNNATFGGGPGRFSPSGEFYASYVPEDVRREHNITGNMTANSAVEVIEGVNYYVPATANPAVGARFGIGKFRYRDPAQKNISLDLTDANFPLLRYADVLLLHAEALYHLTGNADDARLDLVKVRERVVAGGDVETLNDAYRKDDFVSELLDERARELCYESMRRTDLIRFGRYFTILNSLSADASIGFWNPITTQMKGNLFPGRIWFPIPSLEITLNPNLQQNPGY